jgi:hypothetical protein
MTQTEDDVEQDYEEPRRPFTLMRTQRTLQIVLGLFWLLDAGLQFQPFMFGQGFINANILGNAQGQPAVIAWIINNVGHFISPNVAVWNTFFALIQVAIGAGLLFRRTVRPALIVSFFWALGVWFFGEGLGLILTGSASALTGAPGSVLIYGLIGLMAWPRAADARSGASAGEDQRVGVASSAAGRGIGGAVTPLAVWSGYWALAAVLFLLPDNRTTTSVSSAISGMAPGEPGAYAHFLTHLGNQFTSAGVQTSWLLAVASLVIGAGPLVARRPSIYLLAGGVLSVLFWISAQGLGTLLTGSTTDPNTSPLIVLLAVAMVPVTLAEAASWRPPYLTVLSRAPLLAVGGAVALAVALFLSAAYPVAAQESTTTAMAGMAGGAGSGSGAMTGSGNQTVTTASCTAGNNGVARSGLDLTNTPNMIMGSGTIGMNMNGADATAAAGLNATKSNWSYTGPALPAALADVLLAQGGNGTGHVHMAKTGCASDPTFSQEIKAVQYVQSTSQAVARYTSPSLAVAAGYVAVSPTTYPVVYYVNPAIVAANVAARRTLSPAHVDGLVFATTPSGSAVLAAAMYLLPSSVTTPPLPFGAMVQWHQRTAVCGPTNGSATTLDITGTAPCGSTAVLRPTPYLTMVWQVPVAGGPLAIQPPDIQIVEAAVMAGAS